jgi:hypothetical protein
MAISFTDNLTNSRTFLAAMAAILFYDTVNTLAKEYQIIWKERKFGLVKVAYFMNRYFAVMGMSLYMVSLVPLTVAI